MSDEILTKKESLMVIFAFLAYTDATILVHQKTPWKIFRDLDRILSHVQPEQKLVWGPAIDISWLRSIVGLPTVAEYITSALSKPNALVTDLARSNMFPVLTTMLKSVRKSVMSSVAFKEVVSISGLLARPLMDLGVFTNVFLQSASFFSRSMMYVVEGFTDPDTDKNEYTEYTVAIRGANPYSIASFYSVFDISKQVIWDHDKAFSDLPDTVLFDNSVPCISRGTYHALNSHLKMAPRSGFHSAGMSIADFFKKKIIESEKKLKINITGHSLGGIIAPPLALWFYEELKKMGLQDKVEFHISTFGSPTPGNEKFVDYIDEIFGHNCCRYVNELDACVHQFEYSSVKKLLHLYDGAGIGPDPFSVEYVKVVERLAKDKGYTHLKNKKNIPSAICKDSLDDYMSQGVYQHVYPYVDAVERAVGKEEGAPGKKWRKLFTDVYDILDAVYDSYSTLYPFV